MQLEDKKRAEQRERVELERESALASVSNQAELHEGMGRVAEELGDIRRMLKDVRGLVKDGEVPLPLAMSSVGLFLPPDAIRAQKQAARRSRMTEAQRRTTLNQRAREHAERRMEEAERGEALPAGGLHAYYSVLAAARTHPPPPPHHQHPATAGPGNADLEESGPEDEDDFKLEPQFTTANAARAASHSQDGPGPAGRAQSLRGLRTESVRRLEDWALQGGERGAGS